MDVYYDFEAGGVDKQLNNTKVLFDNLNSYGIHIISFHFYYLIVLQE